MNPRRLFHPFAVLALVVTGILALAGLIDTATPTAHAAPLPQNDDAILNIINNSEQSICYVLISPVTSDEWGDDWLGGNETIPPGESRAFDVEAGDYDVGLADCDGNTLLIKQALTIAGQYELRYAPVLEADSLCDALLQSGITLYRQAARTD